MALRMAWRETRGAWRHVALFLTCIGLGVASLVAVGSFAANLERTLGREARALMGGDLELRSSRPLDAAAARQLEALRAAGAATTEIRELVGMVRDPRGGATALVELKAVGPAYPLYGRLDASPPRPLTASLADGGALVEDALLARLGLGVGDRIVVGTAPFTVRGVIVREPDRASGLFTVGPRVLIAADALERTGLVTFGSRVRYRTLVRLAAPVSAGRVREDLARALDDPAVRVVAFDEGQGGLRRFFSQLTTYLGLVGLVSLLVGGIGVASAVRTLIRRKTPTIAILKCVGATSRVLFATYLVQTVALGVIGSVLGAALGVILQPLAVRVLAGLAPFALAPELDPPTLLRAVAAGVLTTVLVALWPLLSLRSIAPSVILRRDVAPMSGLEGSATRRPWTAVLPIVAGLAGLALWQAGSLKIGGIFVGAALGALLGLAGLGRGLVRLARAVPRGRSVAWRQGIANLRRPGGHVGGVVTALG
ncbi:MAG TPA: FtsX-like permease family protein, partial [Solirubrobacteraceae bacterium]